MQAIVDLGKISCLFDYITKRCTLNSNTKHGKLFYKALVALSIVTPANKLMSLTTGSTVTPCTFIVMRCGSQVDQ